MGRLKMSELSMEDRIDLLAGRVEESVGDYPVIFLDTGAVIDFDQEVAKRWKLSDSRTTGEKFMELLCDRLPRVYVTDHAFREITDHHGNHRVNGNCEISRGTYEYVQKLFSDFCDFQRNVTGNAVSIDEARYATVSAYLEAFDKDHKKRVIDPMSDEDKGMVSTALWSRYSAVPRNKEPEQDVHVSDSVIISPDHHIIDTLDMLCNESKGFSYTNLWGVNNRLWI